MKKVIDVILVSLLLTLNTFYIMLCCFSVSIVDFEQVKSRLGSKRHHYKKPWYSSFVVCKEHLFMAVSGELRTCDISKMVLFCQNSLKTLTITARSYILRSAMGRWICLGYFFRFTFTIDLFSSPNIFKY